MSSSTSIIYGYGFEVPDVDGKTILQFLQNHASSLMQMGKRETNVAILLNDLDIETIDSGENIEILATNKCISEELYNALGELSNDDIAFTYAKDIVAIIIEHETGIGIDYQRGQSDECEGDESLIFHEAMPWCYNDKEKSLTENSLHKILKPYATELGIDESEITDLKIEYFG